MTGHFTDDALSDCARGRVTDGEIQAIFEHLLDCDVCYERCEADLRSEQQLREALSRRAVKPGTLVTVCIPGHAEHEIWQGYSDLVWRQLASDNRSDVRRPAF